MPGPLTAPSKITFDPKKQYSTVRFIGDRKVYDFELDEEEAIQNYDRQEVINQIFKDGSIVSESGGSISEARNGVHTANVSATSSGFYTGFDSQTYTLTVSTGGGPGTIVIHVTSDGPDNGPSQSNEGYDFTIDGADPLDGTKFYSVGRFGVSVAFTDPKAVKNLIVADSWTIVAVLGERLPDNFLPLNSLAPNPVYIYSRGRMRRAALLDLGLPTFVSVNTFTINGDQTGNLSLGEVLRFIFPVGSTASTVSSTTFNSTPNTTTVVITGNILNSTLIAATKTLTFPLTETAVSQVFVELLRSKVDSSEDSDLLDPFTLLPAAEREKIVATFQIRDTTLDALPTNAFERIVLPVYHWDKISDVVSRVVEKPIKFTLDKIPGALPATALVGVDQNQELKGIFAQRTNETNGSFITRGFQTQTSTTTPPVGQSLVTVEPGIAYVNGIRIETILGRDIQVPLPTATNAVIGEIKFFHSGTSTYSLNAAVGDSKLPIASVTQLLGQVRKVSQVTHDISGGIDPLPFTPVVALLSATDGSTNYIIGTGAGNGDVYLDGNTAHWNTPNPSVSSITYEYIFNKVMTQGVGSDYEVVDALNSDGNLDSVRFTLAASLPAIQQIVAARIVVSGPSATAGAGGTLANGSYFYKITAIDAAGESYPSSEVSATTTTGNNTINLTWTPYLPYVGYTGSLIYRVYRGTLTGTEDHYFTTSTASFVDNGSHGTGIAGTVPASSGNIGAGTYRWKVTFVTATGETTGGPGSPILTIAGSSSVGIFNVPTGPLSVTSRKIYRTKASGNPATASDADFFLVGTLANNSSVGFIDNVIDGSLGVALSTPAVDTPVDNSQFSVNYDYSLPRRDVVFLRQNGSIDVQLGTPGVQPFRPATPEDVLDLAELYYPNSNQANPIIRNFFFTRVTFIELDAIIKQLDDLQFNFAQQQLENQIASKDAAGYKGIVTDAFASFGFVDLAFNRPSGTGSIGEEVPYLSTSSANVEFAASIDIVNQELSLPRATFNITPTIDTTLNPNTHTPIQLNKNWATLPFIETPAIVQDLWSEITNINPFNNFAPPSPRIRITPDRDFWVDQRFVSITINNNITHYLHDARANGEAVHLEGISPGVLVARFRRMVDEQILYMRQIPVNVFGTNFVPGEDNILVTIADKPTILTPEPTPDGLIVSPGSVTGTVKAAPSVFDMNGNLLALHGDWAAQFVIPPLVPTGTRTVKASGGSGSVAEIPFTATGVLETITNINVIVFVDPPRKDPFAQTFAFSKPTDITSLRFPLATVSNTTQLSVQVRDIYTASGFPGTNVFMDKIFEPQQLTAGESSSNLLKFLDPIYYGAGEYGSIVYLSDSADYRVFTATLGHATANSASPAKWITKNPNIREGEPAGISLVSLNALNWEPRSLTALRHTLYRAQYQTNTAYLYLSRITTTQNPWTHMTLIDDEANPSGTSISWEYSIDGQATKDANGNSNTNKTWVSFEIYSTVYFGQIATQIDIRGTLRTDTTNATVTDTDSSGAHPRISPRVNINNLVVFGQQLQPFGSYIGNANEFLTVDSLTGVKTLKVYADAQIPAGTGIKFYASNGEDNIGDPIWEVIDPLAHPSNITDPNNPTPGAISLTGDNLPAKGGFTSHALALAFDNTISKVEKNRVRLRVDMFQTLDPSSGAPASPFLTPVIKNLASVVNPIVFVT